MQDRIVYQGITFDDVLLEPGYSDVLPRQVDVRTRLTRNISLNLPIVSSPMDTVTSDLAIALAQEERHQHHSHPRTSPSPTRLAKSSEVKRSENGIIVDPITLPPDATVGTAREIMAQNKISGVPITVNGYLKGILTRRDLRFLQDNEQKLAGVMTRDNLVTAAEHTTLEAAERILTENKVEKLLLVDDNYKLKGLHHHQGHRQAHQLPQCVQRRARPVARRRGGRGQRARALRSLIRAGVDVVVVDSAHGHSTRVIQTVAEMLPPPHRRSRRALATAARARALMEAGTDGVKVGIGPGSICTTRVISGVGVPQVTTSLEQAAKGLADSGVPIIADGGISYSGDIVKALAAGAHSVMLGSLLAEFE